MILVVLSIVFAVLAAASNAFGTVMQRRAVLTVPMSRSLRPGLIRDLLRTPIWFAGIIGVILAAVLQALALGTGSLATVQPIFVLELPLALVIGGLVFHVELSRKAWICVACIVGGLALSLLSVAPSGGREQIPDLWWIPTLAIVGGLGAALTIAGLRRPIGLTRAACLGAAAAIGNALTAALIKSAIYILSHDGIVEFLLSWQTYCFAAVGGFSLFLLETAMQGGPLIASQPALTLGDAIVSFCLGVVLYGEALRTGFWIVPAVVGLGVMCFGVFALSRTPCLTDCVKPGETQVVTRTGQPAASSM